ncbi:hypothetical protein Lfu02_15190 [Longispora fulva]|uniref:Single-stranded DNA-binding protein n=1 Tax=Longispora fulva TaxID=619741 RepID=A0A8J7GLJ8_9ACTN|nr:single-stranded DNA-binding protein [Longispora fulva]MBG6140471.1 single stranded DNA-binding protein [Longispora fulva]GIG57147.1 hypothetical protein Lfu02_15190 [Longispora fulva]
MSDIEVRITGNIANEPDLRISKTAKSVIKLRIMVNKRVPDGNGGWKDGKATAYNITAWDKLAENIALRLRKGQRVTVVANDLEPRYWVDKEGVTHAEIEVTAQEVSLSMKFNQRTADAPAEREPAAAF